MSERERLSATGGPMSENENVQSARMLRDDELDAVSGGLSLNFTKVEFKNVNMG